MEFMVNYDIWKIIEKDGQALLDKYNDETTTFVFGVTVYPDHEIWINKDMCKEQKIRTLKHELTHCYIWNFGLYNVPNFTEEMVCDLVASCNDFINQIVEKYKE